MSLPSWLKNTMGSLNSSRYNSITQTPTLFNGDSFDNYPGGRDQWVVDQLARQRSMLPVDTGTAPQAPRYQTRVSTPGIICERIALKIVEALPPTVAVKIESVALTDVHGAAPEVEVTFYGGKGTLALPLTENFPTDADISRILLAMP